jgi:hypothetical protein
MSQSFEKAVKNLLTKMRKNAGFSCRNEYRLRINGLSRYIAYIDARA